MCYLRTWNALGLVGFSCPVLYDTFSVTSTSSGNLSRITVMLTGAPMSGKVDKGVCLCRIYGGGV